MTPFSFHNWGATIPNNPDSCYIQIPNTNIFAAPGDYVTLVGGIVAMVVAIRHFHPMYCYPIATPWVVLQLLVRVGEDEMEVSVKNMLEPLHPIAYRHVVSFPDMVLTLNGGFAEPHEIKGFVDVFHTDMVQSKRFNVHGMRDTYCFRKKLSFNTPDELPELIDVTEHEHFPFAHHKWPNITETQPSGLYYARLALHRTVDACVGAL